MHETANQSLLDVVAAAPAGRASLDAGFQSLLAPLQDSLDAIHRKLDAWLDHPTPPPPPHAPLFPASDPWPAPNCDQYAWQEVVLGAELCADPRLADIRQRLLADILAGVAAARVLAGQLLLAQSAPLERMPEFIGQVGEAYYCWRPRELAGDDPLERALAAWLTRRAESLGLRNSIQLVRPGERFDGGRHAADGRGVAVVAVHGWIVLRDDNKVYTKASVSVK
jgi:hypothetical protein